MLFKACSICGKKTLSFLLNSNGLCNSCVQNDTKHSKEVLPSKSVSNASFSIKEKKSNEILHDSSHEKSQLYFTNIVNLYSDIIEELDGDDDPIKNLELLPTIKEKIQKCDTLITTIMIMM